MLRHGNAAASTPSVQGPAARQDLAIRNILIAFRDSARSPCQCPLSQAFGQTQFCPAHHVTLCITIPSGNVIR